MQKPACILHVSLALLQIMYHSNNLSISCQIVITMSLDSAHRDKKRYGSTFLNFLNCAAVGWAVSCSAFGLLFFFSLSVTISKPLRMMSSSANYRPFLSSFRRIPPFVKLAN